jgi:hypothetical protein
VEGRAEQELANVIAARSLKNLVYMGVHENMCIVDRPFAIKKVVGWGWGATNCAIVRELSLGCYVTALYTTRMQFWGALCGCCEVTTFFLNNLCLLRELNAADGPINAVNGVLLWFSFLVFRMVLFPVWLIWFWQETSTHYDKLWVPLNFVERYLFPSVVAFLLCLSAKWFASLTAGMLKVMGVYQPLPKKLP